MILGDDGPNGEIAAYALKNSDYFDFKRDVKTEEEGRELLARGDVLFVINIPENFSRNVVRGDRPPVLVEADATILSPPAMRSAR